MSLLKRFKFDCGPAANRASRLFASALIFLWATICGLFGQLLKGTGWGLIGALVVSFVVILAGVAFAVVSIGAIIGAAIFGLWKLASRSFAAGRFLLQWAAL